MIVMMMMMIMIMIMKIIKIKILTIIITIIIVITITIIVNILPSQSMSGAHLFCRTTPVLPTTPVSAGQGRLSGGSWYPSPGPLITHRCAVGGNNTWLHTQVTHTETQHNHTTHTYISRTLNYTQHLIALPEGCCVVLRGRLNTSGSTH